MKVKICGITTLEDAQMAVDYGADALGFVFYPKSPRYIHPLKAANIIAQLPPFTISVGVFAQSSSQEVQELLQHCNIHIAQLHNAQLFSAIYTLPTLKVARIKTKDDIINLIPSQYWLCDAFCQEYGGMGRKITLEWFEAYDCSKIILAGGLNIHNINDLKGFGFYGVDVSSGVESSFGKKERKSLEKFIYYAKAL